MALLSTFHSQMKLLVCPAYREDEEDETDMPSWLRLKSSSPVANKDTESGSSLNVFLLVIVWMYFTTFFGSSGAVPANMQGCSSDLECGPGQFCLQKYGTSHCHSCLNCSGYNRETIQNCAREKDDCGNCLPGYEFRGPHCSREEVKDNLSKVVQGVKSRDSGDEAGPGIDTKLIIGIVGFAVLVVIFAGGLVAVRTRYYKRPQSPPKYEELELQQRFYQNNVPSLPCSNVGSTSFPSAPVKCDSGEVKEDPPVYEQQPPYYCGPTNPPALRIEEARQEANPFCRGIGAGEETVNFLNALGQEDGAVGHDDILAVVEGELQFPLEYQDQNAALVPNAGDAVDEDDDVPGLPSHEESINLDPNDSGVAQDNDVENMDHVPIHPEPEPMDFQAENPLDLPLNHIFIDFHVDLTLRLRLRGENSDGNENPGFLRLRNDSGIHESPSRSSVSDQQVPDSDNSSLLDMSFSDPNGSQPYSPDRGSTDNNNQVRSEVAELMLQEFGVQLVGPFDDSLVDMDVVDEGVDTCGGPDSS